MSHSIRTLRTEVLKARLRRELKHKKDPNVVSVKPNKLELSWINERGVWETHTPTFRVMYECGTRVFEDVMVDLEPDYVKLLPGIREWCRDHGCKHKVIKYNNPLLTIKTMTSRYVNDYGDFHRPTLEYIYMSMAHSLAQRSTCLRKKVGVVFTDKNMLHAYCLGYNGSEKHGKNQCDSLVPGHCGCIHAEINALTKNNVDISDATCFVTLSPCVVCAKVLINRNIKRVVYHEDYRNSEGVDLLEARGVEVSKYDDLINAKPVQW